jgi:uncharacterized Zn finger protein
MSPWEPGDRFPRYAPKKPAPSHGIKVNKLGTTWWGQRWIEALEHVLQGDTGRLARGRTYARGGRTHDFVIASGKVRARVTGSREPYRVSLALPQLSDATWQAAIIFMAQKAEFAALLLNNEMPQQIDEAFQAAGASLFPTRRADLETDCDCPDYGDPCKHIAAVHYVLGEALDRDPFLLFELRGRKRDQVLGALRAARAGGGGTTRGQIRRKEGGDPKPPSVALGKLTPKNYAAAPVPLPVLSFSFEAPPAHGAVLRQLGTPTAWNSETPAIETLAPIVERAAERARRLALDETTPEPAPAPAQPPSTPKRRAKRRAKAPRRYT